MWLGCSSNSHRRTRGLCQNSSCLSLRWKLTKQVNKTRSGVRLFPISSLNSASRFWIQSARISNRCRWFPKSPVTSVSYDVICVVASFLSVGSRHCLTLLFISRSFFLVQCQSLRRIFLPLKTRSLCFTGSFCTKVCHLESLQGHWVLSVIVYNPLRRYV